MYEDLLIAISEHRQGNNNITIEIDGELYQGDFKIVFDDDRLDDGHLVITTNQQERCSDCGHVFVDQFPDDKNPPQYCQRCGSTRLVPITDE